MKKNYIKYALAAIIGLQGIVYSADQLPNSTETVAISATVGVSDPAITEFTTTSTPVPTATPILILVPFNQNLYQLCCEKKQSHYDYNLLMNVFYLTVSLYTANIVIHNLLSYTPVTTAFFSFCNNFMQQAWYWKMWTAIKTPVATTFVLGQTYLSAQAIITNTKNIVSGKDFDNSNLWKDREVEPIAIKQAIWHKEILACFGNPAVEGTAPVTGTYHLVGEKKSGVGKIIFDPFDSNQVEILLGIHDTITENLQCSKITIIPSI